MTTPELGPFATATNLLEFFVSELGSLDAKNAIYAALVRAVQARASWASLAMSVLWCGLWPALDAVYGRQLRRFHREPEELMSLICVAFTTLVGQLDLGSVRRIAATLTRSTEREVARARQRELAATAITAPLEEAVPENELEVGPKDAPGDPCVANLSVLGVPVGLSAEAQGAAVHRWLQAVVGKDADLFVAIAVLGESPYEAGKRFRLSPEAIRKRIQRIRTRLARLLSQLRPEVGISGGKGRTGSQERTDGHSASTRSPTRSKHA